MKSPRSISRRALIRRAGALAAGTLLATAASLPQHAAAGSVPGLTGRVVLPSDPDYSVDRRDFNKRFDIHPRAIVYCQSSSDVANAVVWARSRGLPLAVRSGGHSYEAFSLGPGLVLDLTDMNAVDVDPVSMRAVAQPGIRLLPLYRALAPYGITLPGGTCAGVGLGGLTLGGGAGFLTRKWGLTIDNLLALELVDGSGNVLEADASQNPDLFWACRGGGGSFGVVTRLTFQVHPVSDVTVAEIEWGNDQGAAVLAAWQDMAPSWPDDLTTSLQINGGPAGSIALSGLFLGEAAQLQQLLMPLLDAAGPLRVGLDAVSYLESAEHFSDQSSVPFFKAKSDYALRPLSAEAIDTVLGWLAVSPSDGGDANLQFQAYGGAANRIPSEATAFPHRAGTLFSIQYLTHWSDSADEIASLAWINGFYAAMRPYVSGFAYSNMCDVDLDDWQHAYYGGNYDRLVGVKLRYDPDNVFSFAQSIPARGP